MKNIIHRQTELCSDFDVNKLCSIDTEVMDAPTKPLIHQAARFLFIQKGRAILKIQGQDYEIKSQDAVAIFPYEITEVVSVEEDVQMYIVKYKFDILNLLVNMIGDYDQKRSNIFRNLEKYHIMHFDINGWEKIIRMLKELEEELGLESVNAKEFHESYSDVLCMGIFTELIVRMDRINHQDALSVKKQEDDKSEILRYIYLHLNEKVSVQTLADKFFISQSSVRRYILNMTGLTFTDLINEMKVARTANYLLYTDLTLDELAEILGYVDASHISKIFRARLGMRINDYRQCYQKVQKICGVSEARIDYAIVEYIARNYSQDVTLKNVSDNFGIGVRKINEILVRQVGMNFSDYLDRVRINNACKMLLETNQSITDIAYSVGYGTIKTFNRKFINRTLKTPSEFRKQIYLQEGDI